MTEVRTQGALDQLVENAVSFAHCLLNKCQDFAMTTFPCCLDYWENIKAMLLPLFTLYVLPILERLYNFAIWCGNVVKNFVYGYISFVKYLISIPFVIVGRIYAYWVDKIHQVQKCAQGGVCQAKLGCDRLKNGNFTIITIWRNILDMIIDSLNQWLKNSDESCLLPKLINDWNVIGYLKWAKFEKRSKPIDEEN